MWLGACNYLAVLPFIHHAQELFAVANKRARFGSNAQLFMKRQDDRHWHEIPLVPDGTLYDVRTADNDIKKEDA